MAIEFRIRIESHPLKKAAPNLKTAKITNDDILVDDFYEIPTPGPGELVVRMRQAGICGSDLHRLHALQSSGVPGHICVGHEVCGEIHAVGEGVPGIVEGARVAVEPLHRCGECQSCHSGRYNMCTGVGWHMVMGWDPDGPGGHSEYFSMPAYSAVPVPDDISDAGAALVEPLAVGVHAVRMGRPAYRASIAIIGAGSIGLAATAAARATGAAQITVLARYEHQQQAALELGATQVIRAGADATEDELRRLLGNSELPDIVIESVGGSAGTANLAMQLARPGGTIVVAGAFWGDAGVPAQPLVEKELQVVGSHTYSRDEQGVTDFEHAIAILRADAGIATTLVTHEFGLEDAKEAYRTAGDKTTGAIKVMFTA